MKASAAGGGGRKREQARKEFSSTFSSLPLESFPCLRTASHVGEEVEGR